MARSKEEVKADLDRNSKHAQDLYNQRERLYDELNEIEEEEYQKQLNSIDGKLKQEKANLISSNIDTALALIRQAEEVAKEFGLPFQFKVAHGMGGVYKGDHDGWHWVSSAGRC